MIKIFTQTDLIRYLYQETTEEEKKEIEKALQRDPELKTLFTELSAVRKELECAQLEPSEATVRNILDYSRNSGSR
jgi:anti-sigma factor RsiW